MLNDIRAEEKATFMASAERARGEPLRQRVLNIARSTEKGLAAYVEWLENAAPSCEMRSKDCAEASPRSCIPTPPQRCRRRSGRRGDET